MATKKNPKPAPSPKALPMPAPTPSKSSTKPPKGFGTKSSVPATKPSDKTLPLPSGGSKGDIAPSLGNSLGQSGKQTNTASGFQSGSAAQSQRPNTGTDTPQKHGQAAPHRTQTDTGKSDYEYTLERMAYDSPLVRRFVRRLALQRNLVDGFLNSTASLNLALNKMFMGFGRDEEEDLSLLRAVKIYLAGRDSREAKNLPHLGIDDRFGTPKIRHNRQSHDPCREMYPDDAQSQELCRELSEYGIALWQEGSPLSEEQLIYLRDTIALTGERLQELLANCGAPSEEMLSSQEIFAGVFGPLEFGFNAEATLAKTTTYRDADEEVILSRIVFAPSTFNEEPNVISRIIVHELGHVFQNMLGQVAFGETATFTIRPAGAQQDLQITVTGGVSTRNDPYAPEGAVSSAGTSTILDNYLNATQQYWSGGVGVEFGDWTENGFYNASTPGAEVYTNQVLEETLGITAQSCSRCDEGTTIFLIDRDNQCIPNNDGQCISYTPGTALTDTRAVYVRRAGIFYSGGYGPNTNSRLFYNENERDDRNPSEGFADSFSLFITVVADPVVEEGFPANEPRREFFDSCMCCWLANLLRISLGGCADSSNCE